MRQLMLLTSALVLAAAPTLAKTVHVPMTLVTATGPGASVGEIVVSDSKDGVKFKLVLHGLPPGQHGFHVHQNGSCDPATGADGKVTPAGAAGPHWDPGMTGMHMGPLGKGHLGDLPLIDIATSGLADYTLTAPRIESVADLMGHALMIHEHGDTYSDQPAPLGGGGARLACGVVK